MLHRTLGNHFLLKMRMTPWRKQLICLDWNDAWTSTSAALMVWDAFACMQVLCFSCEIRVLAAKCWDKYQLFQSTFFSLLWASHCNCDLCIVACSLSGSPFRFLRGHPDLGLCSLLIEKLCSETMK